MMHCLRTRQVIGVSPDEAWKFFSDPYRLADITPPALGFEVRTPELPQIYPGMIIEYTVRPLLGIPLRWVTEITQVRSGYYFVDEQRVGPYKMWHHEHFFRECAEGTEVEDIVHYVIGWGPLDALLDRLIVGPRVRAIFDYRRAVLESRFPVAARSVS